jgi:hypothetical protein
VSASPDGRTPRHRSHGVLAPTSCSVLSAAAGEPLAGSAPHAKVWIAIEQPGPWGRKALHDSHLSPDAGRRLDLLSEGTDISILLIRRPGAHADAARADASATTRAVLIASPERLLTTQVIGDDALLALVGGLDAERLVAGEPPTGDWTTLDAPIALICTNGRRDTCCAVSGRHLLDQVLDEIPLDRLWECSHLGGHRFAPTAVLLPSGLVLGRAEADDVVRGVAGGAVTHALRGRSALVQHQQAAEIAVLKTLIEEASDVDAPMPGLAIIDARASTGERNDGEESFEVDVQHPDGRRWHVHVSRQEAALASPSSCGKAPEFGSHWVAETPRRVDVRQDVGRDDDSRL